MPQDPEITRQNRARALAANRLKITREGELRRAAAARAKNPRNQKIINQSPISSTNQLSKDSAALTNQSPISDQSVTNQSPISHQSVNQSVAPNFELNLMAIITQQNQVISMLYEKVLAMEIAINQQSISNQSVKNPPYKEFSLYNNIFRGGCRGGDSKHP